jgi:hypothetical protein
MVVRAASQIAARHVLPEKDLVARYLLKPLPQGQKMRLFGELEGPEHFGPIVDLTPRGRLR